MNFSPDAVLAPLTAADDALTLLEYGSADPAARSALLRVAAAVESVLRRWVEDEAAVPWPPHPRAPAPGSLSPEALISELRQRNRISIELAAELHDLLRIRRRLEESGNAAPTDADVALRVASRVTTEVRAAHPTYRVLPPGGESDSAVGKETERVHSVPAPGSGRKASLWLAAAAAGGLVLVALLVVWWGLDLRGDEEADMRRGVALFRSGAADEAAVLFRRYADAHPDDPTPRLYLARIDRRAGRFDEARQELRAAVAADPVDAAVQREIGFLLLDAGESEAAARRFRSALLIDSASAEGWIGLVRSLREAGQTEAAARILARAPEEVRALVRPASP